LIGISAFDALAFVARGVSASRGGPDKACGTGSGAGPTNERAIATWVDAWRGEVYAALYEHGREIAPPVVAHPERLLAELAGRDVLFVGDGAATYRDLIVRTAGERARIAVPPSPPLAGTIARLATGGEKQAPHAIRPLYVRRPA
jgi:tRNA threonylcarbamoyladenosine biosynthesis protein TsaB